MRKTGHDVGDHRPTEGQITLTVHVASHDWQRAEGIARSVSGVHYVINNLRVRQHGTTGATG